MPGAQVGTISPTTMKRGSNTTANRGLPPLPAAMLDGSVDLSGTSMEMKGQAKVLSPLRGSNSNSFSPRQRGNSVKGSSPTSPTTAAMPKLKSPTAAKPVELAPLKSPKGFDLMRCVALILQTKESCDSLNNMSGDFTDEENAATVHARDLMEGMKLSAAKSIMTHDEKVAPRTEEERAQLENFFETMVVNDTDSSPASLALVEGFLKKVDLDYVTLANKRNMVLGAIKGGSHRFVSLLLDLPGVIVETVPAIEAAFWHQQARIPLALVLLQKVFTLGRLEPHQEKIGRLWYKFFNKICSSKEAIPREDRTGRLALISLMLSLHPAMQLYTTGEGDDHRTYFARAAYEGDDGLVRLLIRTEGANFDINHKMSDGTTALIHAVESNDLETVRALVDAPKIELNLKTSKGTALGYAKTQKKAQSIISLLVERGAQEEAPKTPTPTPPSAPLVDFSPRKVTSSSPTPTPNPPKDGKEGSSILVRKSSKDKDKKADSTDVPFTPSPPKAESKDKDKKPGAKKSRPQKPELDVSHDYDAEFVDTDHDESNSATPTTTPRIQALSPPDANDAKLPDLPSSRRGSTSASASPAKGGTGGKKKSNLSAPAPKSGRRGSNASNQSTQSMGRRRQSVSFNGGESMEKSRSRRGSESHEPHVGFNRKDSDSMEDHSDNEHSHKRNASRRGSSHFANHLSNVARRASNVASISRGQSFSNGAKAAGRRKSINAKAEEDAMMAEMMRMMEESKRTDDTAKE